MGRDSYWLDGPGIESRWGEDFPLSYRPVLAYPGHFGGKRLGRGVNCPSPSSAEVKEREGLYLCSLCTFVMYV